LGNKTKKVNQTTLSGSNRDTYIFDLIEFIIIIIFFLGKNGFKCIKKYCILVDW